MIARNFKISVRQQKRMLVLDMFGLSSLIVPYIAVNSAGAGGIITVVAGTFLALCYAGILIWFSRQFQENNKGTIPFMEYAKNSVGSFMTGVFATLYVVKYFLILTFAASLFSKVIGQTLLTDTNTNIILAVLLIISCYGAMHGIEKRARMAEVLFYLVMVPMVLYLLLGIPKIDLANLITGTIKETSFDKTGWLWGSYFNLLTFASVEGILFTRFCIKCNSGRKYASGVLQAVLIVGVINILVYLVTVGMLGVAETGSKVWSSVIIMQIIEIPGNFVRRQDKIMLAFWTLGIFHVLSCYIFYMIQTTKHVIDYCFLNKTKDSMKADKYLALVYGLLAYGLAASMGSMETQFLQFGKYMQYVGIPQSLILPLLFIGVSKIRKRRMADEQ